MKLFRWIKRANTCKTSSSDKCVQISLFDEIPFKNDKVIVYYKTDGSFVSKTILDEHNLEGIHGMMVRCTMNNGEMHEGFADSYGAYDREKFDGTIHDFIYLWTWDNLDEKTHQLVGDMDTKFEQTFESVKIADIQKIDAIMYSNPRWGGRLHNRFFIDTSKCEMEKESYND